MIVRMILNCGQVVSRLPYHSSTTMKLVNGSMFMEGIVRLQEFHVASHQLFYLKRASKSVFEFRGKPRRWFPIF